MKYLMSMLTYTIVGLMLTFNATARTPVTDGLVSFWTLDEDTIVGDTIEDVWGGNNATSVGLPRTVDGGLELDGNGDFIQLPNVGNFGRQIGEYTFEVWFKTTNKEKSSAIFRILEHKCGEQERGTGILINTRLDPDKRPNHEIKTEQDWLLIERTSVRENGCGGTTSGRKKSVSDGKWHQIVFTAQTLPVKELDQELRENFKDGDCIQNKVYLDRELITEPLSCSFPPNFIAHVEPIFLGAENNMGQPSRFFEGIFRDVRIYDRALTEREIYHNNALSVEAVQKLPTVWGALKRGR